jgi:hypothetical protein
MLGKPTITGMKGSSQVTTMPTEHERETAFLKRCVRFDGSLESNELCDRLGQIQRDERSVRRAWWMMALVTALSLAGVVYGAVFLDDFPFRMSEFGSQFIIKASCGVGIGALICLLVFTVCWLAYRRQLNKRRQECRQLVIRLLESHCGLPAVGSSPTTSRQSTGADTDGKAQTPAGATGLPIKGESAAGSQSQS